MFGRTAYIINTIALALLTVSAAGIFVLAVISLLEGSLRLIPYMAGLACVYNFISAVSTYAHGKNGRLWKALLLLVLAVFCAAFAYISWMAL